jgi:beta-glucosidase
MNRIIQIKTLIIITVLYLCSVVSAQEKVPAYKNTELPVKERVSDLISRMTLKEKVSPMSSLAPAIERLVSFLFP